MSKKTIKLFFIFPIVTIKEKEEQKVLKIFGLPILKTKYYLFGFIPIFLKETKL